MKLTLATWDHDRCMPLHDFGRLGGVKIWLRVVPLALELDGSALFL